MENTQSETARCNDSLRSDVEMVPLGCQIARDLYLNECIPLHRAALKGDWKAAENIISRNAIPVNARITEGEETALHIAAAAEHVFFVDKLVAMTAQSDLGIQNKKGHTALSFAAATGNVRIAMLMVEKNSELPSIHGPQAKSPLYLAALSGHSDMADYLFHLPELLFISWTPEDRIELLNTCISSGLYGLALKIVQQHEELAVADENGETPLHVLARTPSAFAGGIQQGMWERIINSFPNCKGAHNEMLMQNKAFELLECLWRHVIGQQDLEISQITGNTVQLLFVAAELGNDKFLVELLRFYPDFIREVNSDNQTIFHIAVKHRHENIFNLIYEIGTFKELLATYRDGDDNNMLHLAASIAPPNKLNVVSGAALQMQRQLIWYKAVEKIVPPSYREMKNGKGKGDTPHNLFIANHKELMKEGEQWMKGTAKSCMLVATLIATVAYTTAFTLPGGNNNSTGAPILLNNRFFTVFSVSEAVAMLSSSTSILMFLSILTSRYAEHDFLVSLPIWLMIGFTTLFVSVAAMMIAFCTTFVLSYHQGLAQVLVTFSLFAFVPIVFILLNYSLLFDIIRSRFGTRFLFRSRKRLFS